MRKIDLAYANFRIPDQTNRLIQHCRELGDEIGSRPQGHDDIAQFEPADGRISWNLLNSVTQYAFTDRSPIFCEWGSGIGLVTLIAASMGMSATGIEIEEELVDLSRELAQQYFSPASFIHASIYPKDNPIPSIDYADVDLFFAYPWPDQITQMTALFERVASNGAIFVSYHGGQNYRVLQC